MNFFQQQKLLNFFWITKIIINMMQKLKKLFFVEYFQLIRVENTWNINIWKTCLPFCFIQTKIEKHKLTVPVAFFQVTWGRGNPSALHSNFASLPWAKALSVGSRIQRGGTKMRKKKCELQFATENWQYILILSKIEALYVTLKYFSTKKNYNDDLLTNFLFEQRFS